MWRALFLAMGLYCCLLGVEALAIDKAVLITRKPAAQSTFGALSRQPPRREVVPPPWAPWSLISAGAVVVLYSFSIPRRVKD